jgi:mycofactocin system glycosyltransferase
VNYRLASGISIEEQQDGGVLVAARPLRLVKLNPPLLRLARRLQAESVTPASAAERKVLETLAKRGFVSREWPPLGAAELPKVSVVIPVKDRPDDLRNCLTSLAALDYPGEKLEIIVVDDGSTDHTPEVAVEFGATLVASGAIGGGPAVARNKGAAVASGEILAFIDSDCTASPLWLRELLPAFAEPGVGAVGGYVDGMHQAGPLDRYEAVMSSLNLGRRAMIGGAGEDTFYLPSCNLLLRRDVFVAAGGFNSELQVGEDVDLTWRLRDGAWTIVYLPRGVVCHAHRSRFRPFMKRRFDYGTSEGLLHRLHPVRGKKMLIPPMLATILLLLAAALVSRSPWPLLSVLVLLVIDTLVLRQKTHKQGVSLPLRQIFPGRVRAVGSLGYYLGYHLLRYYLVPVLLATLLYPPLALLLLALVLGVGLVDHRVRKPELTLPGFYVCYLLEQFAYGCGVFWGCCKVRSFASYRLDLNGLSGAV